MNANSSEEAPMQLLSTVREPSLVEPLAPNEPSPERHCTEAELVRPNSSIKRVRLLRDTGALQSLVCIRNLSNDDCVSTGEFRLIRGVTGEVIPVPLVQVTQSCVMCQETFLCGLVSTLAVGIAVLVCNDIRVVARVTELNVVTSSQTANRDK